MNISELKALLEKTHHPYNKRRTFPLIEITDENMRLLQDKFPYAYEFLKEFGDIYIAKKIDDMSMYQHFCVWHSFREMNIISDTEIWVAWIGCGAQYKKVIYSNEQNCFKFEDGQIIADSAEGLFEYWVSDESIVPVNILPETYEKLKSSGWYEGRRIDISNITEKFRKDGILLTVEQMDFLQEFGGIKGLDAYDEEFRIYDRIIMPDCGCDCIVYFKSRACSREDRCYGWPLNIVAYRNKVDMLRIGESGNGLIPLWLSTNGKLFRDDGGQLGRTALEGLQTVLVEH